MSIRWMNPTLIKGLYFKWKKDTWESSSVLVKGKGENTEVFGQKPGERENNKRRKRDRKRW
jgi:hypothetical protein